MESEEIRAVSKRIGKHTRLGVELITFRHFFVHHKTTTDGVINALHEFTAVRICRDETHAVGMGRQGFQTVENEIGLLLKWNDVNASEIQSLLTADCFNLRWHRIHIDRLWCLTFQAEEHRFVSAVAFAGEGE